MYMFIYSALFPRQKHRELQVSLQTDIPLSSQQLKFSPMVVFLNPPSTSSTHLIHPKMTTLSILPNIPSKYFNYSDTNLP